MLEPKIIAGITLNATTYTLIDMGGVAANSVLLQCRTSIDVYIAESSSPAADAYFTMKAGSTLVFDLEGLHLGTSFKKLYAKAAGGTPVLEILYLK